MKEITVTEPVFVTRFSCSGSACRDHCCKGWKITLDKTTVKKYLASKDATIRTIAQDHIILLKKNNSHWGEIKLPSALGNCPYLDEDRLCRVQKTLGAKALSHTCSSFPRAHHTYKNEVRNSLSLACPEVTSRILNDPDAMALGEKQSFSRHSILRRYSQRSKVTQSVLPESDQPCQQQYGSRALCVD